MSIRQIRHSVAVRVLDAGLPIEKVSKTPGHSNVRIAHQT
jgi:hypothetical protein